jgi:NAD(P)-dependent dehydrogenase (short-subunit alcohol dehydrogenase family)
MFKGYNVMVTGATSGIGLGISKEFLAHGAKVIGIGRDFSKIKEDLGDNFIPCKCDVTDEDQIIEACKLIESEFSGRLDVLISNAGAGTLGHPETVTTEEFNNAAKLLLLAGMLFTKHTMPYLRKSKNPSICHTSSIASYMTTSLNPDSFLYNVFKLALNSYACQCANALAPVRVNAICPGLIRTNIMPEAAWDAMSTPEALQTIPSGRIADVSEVAKLVTFLSSEKAMYITGDVIKIDGGWYTNYPRIAI